MCVCVCVCVCMCLRTGARPTYPTARVLQVNRAIIEEKFEGEKGKQAVDQLTTELRYTFGSRTVELGPWDSQRFILNGSFRRSKPNKVILYVTRQALGKRDPCAVFTFKRTREKKQKRASRKSEL